MNKTNTRNIETNRTEESWKRAAARGALVWGTVYSTVTSGAACLLAPVVSGSTPAFSDVFLNSLVIFPSAGAAGGVALWKARKARRSTGRKEEEFLSPKRLAHKHPWRVRSKAA